MLKFSGPANLRSLWAQSKSKSTYRRVRVQQVGDGWGYPKHLKHKSRPTSQAAGSLDDASHGHDHLLAKQPLLAELLQSVRLGGLPDGQAKSNLVYEVGQVVHQVQSIVIHSTLRAQRTYVQDYVR